MSRRSSAGAWTPRAGGRVTVLRCGVRAVGAGASGPPAILPDPVAPGTSGGPGVPGPDGDPDVAGPDVTGPGAAGPDGDPGGAASGPVRRPATSSAPSD